MPLILASTSRIRHQLLAQAGVDVTALPARIDEDAIRRALQQEGAQAHDIADALAESKAAKLAGRHPDKMVLGCDQVLAVQNAILSKPETPDDARAQLTRLRGATHMLLSAAVIYDQGRPVWRHVGKARLTMRDFSDSYLDSYLARNWPDIAESVGGYKLEAEGVRLFTQIQGDYFTILGLPLMEVLSYLTLRGVIDG